MAFVLWNDISRQTSRASSDRTIKFNHADPGAFFKLFIFGNIFVSDFGTIRIAKRPARSVRSSKLGLLYGIFIF